MNIKDLFFRSASAFLAFPRFFKRILLVALDSGLCILTLWIAYFLRLDAPVHFFGEGAWSSGATLALVSSVLIAIPIFIRFGLYRAIFRYGGIEGMQVIIISVGIYGFLFANIFTIIGVSGVPRAVGIIQPLLLMVFIASSRALGILWIGRIYSSIIKGQRRRAVLIYGAGQSGRELAAAMNSSRQMELIGFIDDDKRLQGRSLNGYRVYDPQDLSNLVARYGVRDLLLAMSNLTRERRNKILNFVRTIPVAVRTLPSMSKLAQGKISLKDVHDLDVNDLIGRDPLLLPSELLAQSIKGYVVLVTGAGGSIGSELCKQIFLLNPRVLVMIDHSESALYAIQRDLESSVIGQELTGIPRIVLSLNSVNDESAMRKIIGTWAPKIIFHAAAYKHVPIVEDNPVPGIKNNFFGTYSLAKIAAEEKVDQFLFVSTDKAVRSHNVLGASKRLAEVFILALSLDAPDTIFTVVRFGNVLGSSGSVVPKFRRQILDGGPVTVTHPEITRYFMTIQEAAQLLIQSSMLSKSGDVFVLDMGTPIKILELAERMIELSGHELKRGDDGEGDIEITFTGLRPGEKLFEEPFLAEFPEATNHPKIMRDNVDIVSLSKIESKIERLRNAVDNNDEYEVRALLAQLVPDYKPSLR